MSLPASSGADHIAQRQKPAAKSASDSQPGPSQIRDAFEAKVRKARNGALLVACLDLLSRLFAICLLALASIVLRGGSSSALRTFDFLLIYALLLLEGARLFISEAFHKLLTKTLFQESHRPEDFEFKDMQDSKGNRLHLIGQTLTLVFTSTSLTSIAMRSFLTGSHSSLSGNDSGNVAYATYLFYLVVMVNSLLTISSTLLHAFLRSHCDGGASDMSQGKQNCLARYHDEVYRMAMDVGFLEASQLDVLEFAFTKLLSDYKRNIRPPLIKAQNKDLLCYMYHNQQGIAMCCGYLKFPNVWKQLVAANLPGFWVQEQRIELQVALFWALRERMCGAGKDAESALNSIACLAQSWDDMPKSKPYPFLINDPATATNIVDTLVHLILEPL
ncbi:hypothetical protein L7F22_050717 [Adiantum nelumboides]|nr:hypothetical protein [Adiantum nelumboides]